MSLADTNNLHIAGHIDGGKQTQAFWEWDASRWRLGEATPQGSIGGVGGDTVSPPSSPPPAVIMAMANREGEKNYVCDGREVLHLGIVLFISPSVLGWHGTDGLNLAF